MSLSVKPKTKKERLGQMKNYLCKKCGTLVQNEQRPNVSGCPKAPSHDWYDLGKCGSKKFQCKKCGILVHSEQRPDVRGCPKAPFHDWYEIR
jgi:rubrerythrin